MKKSLSTFCRRLGPAPLSFNRKTNESEWSACITEERRLRLGRRRRRPPERRRTLFATAATAAAAAAALADAADSSRLRLRLALTTAPPPIKLRLPKRWLVAQLRTRSHVSPRVCIVILQAPSSCATLLLPIALASLFTYIAYTQQSMLLNYFF